jgi:phosphatidate cytidylyltransferase
MNIPTPVLYAIGAIFGLLALATALVWWIGRKRPGEASTELMLRVRSWWVMIGVFTVAMVIDRMISTIFLGFIAYLALKEYFSLIPTRRIDRLVMLFAYLAVPIQFYWAHIGWYGMFAVFIPLWMFLFLPMIMVLQGQTEGFLRAVGTVSWGLMMTVFTLSHTAMMLTEGDVTNGVAGGAGLLLFLVFMTQFNDVAQFTWGKLFGKRAIVPSVSPKKTWEGFLGGAISTACLAALVGPYLTVMPWLWSAAAGAMIAVAGFIGDVNMSAVKRDLQVKDSGGLIPGHGGILDRVDSLTYAAPIFLHFFYYFFVGGRI